MQAYCGTRCRSQPPKRVQNIRKFKRVQNIRNRRESAGPRCRKSGHTAGNAQTRGGSRLGIAPSGTRTSQNHPKRGTATKTQNHPGDTRGTPKTPKIRPKIVPSPPRRTRTAESSRRVRALSNPAKEAPAERRTNPTCAHESALPAGTGAAARPRAHRGRDRRQCVPRADLRPPRRRSCRSRPAVALGSDRLQ